MGFSVSPRTLAAVLTPLVRWWGRSLRVVRINRDVFVSKELRRQRPVIALWHDEMFPLIPNHEGEGMVCVVSQSRDGDLLARCLERFGFLTARGSSSRGGMRALVAAARQMKRHGVGAIFTVDGPRGPRHKVKSGIIYLAVRADSPIVPVRAIMERRWIFHKAWDKFQLPWPFSRCRIVYGTPYRVQGSLDDPGLIERECLRLEEIMHHLGER